MKPKKEEEKPSLFLRLLNPNSEALRNSEMSLAFFLVLCFPFLLSLLHCAAAQGTNNNSRPICDRNFQCRSLGFFGFPFYDSPDPRCGLCRLICNETVPVPVIQLAPEDNRFYDVVSKQRNDSLVIRDQEFQNLLRTNSCNAINPLTFPSSPSITYSIFPPLTIFKCNNNPEVANLTERHFDGSYHRYRDCEHSNLYYRYPINYADTSDRNNVPHQCSIVDLPHTPQGMLPPGINTTDLFRILASEFTFNIQISEDCLSCHYNGGFCQNDGQQVFCVYAAKGKKRNVSAIIAAGASLVAVVIMVFLLVCIWRKCSSCKSVICLSEITEEQDNFEVMLKNFGPIAPEKFRYSDIKKMTNSFKQTLGQGGFGHVYKGTLRSGKLVAVKVLNGSKGNGEDFINEVASISRTSHVNIVGLLGFCFEGREKRALVYEFMPNGSLEKFIYDQRFLVDRQLAWETLYQISIGIARGLEYLHRGCNTRILHFDIKPHNILLDENFCPKIADFGLAKLCPGKESILSTMTARGTVGYIAPEVFCRTIGGVSYKSDVYSYGMMVSEMVGGRKNIDVRVAHTSEIYFPHWIHKQLESNNELGLHGIVNEDENKIARKMIIVSLWCIQTDPSTRPSMTRVVEMLEGSLESLQIPPKPYLSSPSRSPN